MKKFFENTHIKITASKRLDATLIWTKYKPESIV